MTRATPPPSKLKRAKPIGWMKIPVSFDGDTTRVHVYARRNGLAITSAPWFQPGFRVTHIQSGRRVSRDFRTLTEARAFLRRTAPLCDWTMPREALGCVAIAVATYQRELAAMAEVDNE